MNIQGLFPLGLTGIYKVKIFCNGVLETGQCGNIYLCSRCWQMLSSWLLATNRHPFQRLLNIYQYTTACTPSCYFQSGLSPPKLPSHTVNCDCDINSWMSTRCTTLKKKTDLSPKCSKRRSPILSKWQLPPSRGSGQRSWGIRSDSKSYGFYHQYLPRIQLLTILTTFHLSSLVLATITFVWNHLPGLSFLSLPEPRSWSALFTASVRSCPSVRWPAGSTHSGLPSLTSLIFSPTLCPSLGSSHTSSCPRALVLAVLAA